MLVLIIFYVKILFSVYLSALVILVSLFFPMQIKDMTKELDMLLHSIEQPGGFRDVCTLSQKSSVEALEQGIQDLSEKCRMWRVLLYA